MVHVGSPGPARPSGGSTTLLTPNWPPKQQPGRIRGCRPLMKARRPLCRVTSPKPPDPDLPAGRSSHTCICHQGCHGTSPHPRHLPRGSWGCGPHPSLLPLTGLLLLRAASSARWRLWATLCSLHLQSTPTCSWTHRGTGCQDKVRARVGEHMYMYMCAQGVYL